MPRNADGVEYCDEIGDKCSEKTKKLKEKENKKTSQMHPYMHILFTSLCSLKSGCLAIDLANTSVPTHNVNSLLYSVF